MTGPSRARGATTPVPSATPTPRLTATAGELTALQRALAGERAAVYGYGVVGGQASASDRPRALDALARHAVRRDDVQRALTAAGAEPEFEAPAYGLPFPVVGPSAAHRLAVHLEQGLTAGYADLVAAADPSRRADAASRLVEAALAARAWGAAPTPFPGLPERS